MVGVLISTPAVSAKFRYQSPSNQAGSTIKQYGHHNNLSVVKQTGGGSGNTAKTKQNGYGNKAFIHQSGSNGGASIVQNGNGNVGIISQSNSISIGGN
jgi:hypothetical protein